MSPNAHLRLRAVLAAFGAALLFCGCGTGSDAEVQSRPAEVPRNVRTLRIQPADLDEFLSISGPLHPLRGTDISAEEGGVVAAIPNDQGASVAAGDVLIMLDRDLLAAERDAAAARRDLNAFNEERTRMLYEANSVSRVEMLQAETELRSADAAARIAQLRFERAAIKAPFGGVVAVRYVEHGQLVAPGTPVARIVDPYVLELAGHLTEREVGYLRRGAEASVSCAGIDEPLAARVQWVGVEADPLTGKFPVEIHIENPELALHAGAIGCARVLKTRHEDVITIPRDAVVQRPTGPVVFVVEDDHARQRRLTLGPDQGLMVVVAEGLAAGDLLVVRGQRDIHDGSAVAVQEEATAADGTLAADPGVVSATHAAGQTPR